MLGWDTYMYYEKLLIVILMFQKYLPLNNIIFQVLIGKPWNNLHGGLCPRRRNTNQAK